MKKMILNLVFVVFILTLTSCSEKSGSISDLNVKTDNLPSNITPITNNLSGSTVENTNSGINNNTALNREVTSNDNFSLVSIQKPGDYTILSEDSSGNKVEFSFINFNVLSSNFLINDSSNGLFWSNYSDTRICYISEIKKQIFFNLYKKEIKIDNFSYSSYYKEGKGILKIVDKDKQNDLGKILLKQGYFTESDNINPNLECKCKNWKNLSGDIINDKKYKLSSVNNDLSFTLISTAGEKIDFIEKELSKFKMTAGLKSDCYLDMLKSQIKSILNNKEFVLRNYDEISGIGEIILDFPLKLTLTDLLQRQGFIENECNTNDIDPTLMLWCQK